MFQHKSVLIKSFIFTVSVLLSGYIGYVFYDELLRTSNLFYASCYMFGITWVSIFWGFILFQTFKQFRFPKGYYQRKWFDSFKFYKVIGVTLFRLILINSVFRHLNKRVYLKEKTKQDIIRFIKETEQSETSHILAFIALSTVNVMLIYNSLYTYAIILAGFNVLLNLYPVFLQRNNRFMISIKYKNLLESS